MTTGDRLWDVGLLLVGLILTAFGLVNAGTAPIWIGVGAAVLLLAVLHSQRHRIGRSLAGLGVRVGGKEAVARYVPEPSKPDPDPALARVRDEQRAALRAVRDALALAMVHAEQDREHGSASGPENDEAKATAAAGHAGAMAHEVDDEQARALVIEWKRQFDVIPKG